VPYFLVTFILPSELRALARSHQRQVYTLFFRATAAALQQLAADPRFLVGGAVDRCPQCGQVMQARPLAPPRSRGPPAPRFMTRASRPAGWTRRLMRPWQAVPCSREEAVRRWSACARQVVGWCGEGGSREMVARLRQV
jgi:hypothetical protein